MRSHCGSVYATLVQPLNAVPHSFRWGAEQQDAFDKLKERISQIGLLYFIDCDRPLHVAVDASEDGPRAGRRRISISVSMMQMDRCASQPTAAEQSLHTHRAQVVDT